MTFLTQMIKIMLLVLLNVKVLGKQECVDDSRFLVGGIHAAKQSTNFMLKPSSNTREEADHEHLLVRPGTTHHVRELSLANFLHQYILEEGVAIVDLAIFEGLDHRIHDRNGLNANLEGHIIREIRYWIRMASILDS